MSDSPVLFGERRFQTLLETIHLDGVAHLDRQILITRLDGTGLIAPAAARRGEGDRLTFDAGHPAHHALRVVLAAVTGQPGVEPTPPASPLPPHAIDPNYPLAHPNSAAFRILHVLAIANGPLSEEGLVRRIPDRWRYLILKCARRLVDECVLAMDGDGRLSFASSVPPAYPRLVSEIAAILGRPELPPGLADLDGPRPTAFNRAKDGAPLLFGTDAVLRNFMALAKHGPLDLRDLRRATGAGHVLREGRNQAPFGRGAVVRVWEDEEFTGVMLDPAYPVYEPLRRLLLRMEKTWPIAPMQPWHRLRAIPPPEPWNGDTTAIFGSSIPTAILMSIGVLGWTFEALFCAVATGKYREAVKGVIPRLEEDGILQGSRPRGPGANVRVLTIADSFPAKAELEELLQACVVAWPYYANTTRSELEQMSPKTRAHLRKRGLL